MILHQKDLKEKGYWDSEHNRGMYRRKANNPVVKFFSKQRFDYISSKIDVKSIESYLDVGCGTGFSTIHVPFTKNVVGVDFSFKNLKFTPLKNKIQGSGYNLPFKSNSFDIVTSWEFLHHLEEPEKALIEMSRITKKYLILFEPNKYNLGVILYSLYDRSERRQLEYSKKTLLRFLDLIKFKLIACESVGWVYAGSCPEFSLKICSRLPYINLTGVTVVLICEKLHQ